MKSNNLKFGLILLGLVPLLLSVLVGSPAKTFAGVIFQDNFTDTVWNLPTDTADTPHIASNGYVLLNQNNPIGVSGTVDGFALYTPGSASNWYNAHTYYGWTASSTAASFGIVECTTPSDFLPYESWGFRACGNWGGTGYSFSTYNDMSTSSDNNFVIIKLHTPVTLNSSDYYAVGIQPIGGGSAIPGGYGLTWAGTNTTANMGNFAFSSGQKNLTSVTPITAPWIQLFGGSFASPLTSPVYYLSSDFTDASTTLRANSIYVVAGVLTVASSSVLNIPNGTVLKFSTATTSGLIVDGTLNAAGPNSSIFFTSLKDDMIANDTNLDASSTSPSPGDWGGIEINPGGAANLSDVVIRYGGSIGTSSAMIFNNGGVLNISSSTVAYSSGDGIRNFAGTTTVTADDLGYNAYGLYFDSGSASIVSPSVIHDNSSFGVFNSTSSVTIEATGNYWGSLSGPKNASTNPNGHGDNVSDYVHYIPFEDSTSTTMHYLIGTSSASVGSCELTYSNTSPYSMELSNSVGTWNARSGVVILAATSSPADLTISAVTDRSDLAVKGNTYVVRGDSAMYLNAYFLDTDTFDERQNTITHELGHALGLDHSFTGNIMFLNQSAQTLLGPQDEIDYDYIWKSQCP